MEYMQEVRRIQKTESVFWTKKSRHVEYDQMVVCVLPRSDVSRGISTVKADIREKEQNTQVDFHSLVRGHVVNGEAETLGRKELVKGFVSKVY